MSSQAVSQCTQCALSGRPNELGRTKRGQYEQLCQQLIDISCQPTEQMQTIKTICMVDGWSAGWLVRWRRWWCYSNIIDTGSGTRGSLYCRLWRYIEQHTTSSTTIVGRRVGRVYHGVLDGQATRQTESDG